MYMLKYHASLGIDTSIAKRKSGMPIGAKTIGGTKIEKKILFFRELSVAPTNKIPP